MVVAVGHSCSIAVDEELASFITQDLARGRVGGSAAKVSCKARVFADYSRESTVVTTSSNLRLAVDADGRAVDVDADGRRP